MNTGDLLTTLSRQRVHLWVDGEQLRCRAPEGVLTPGLRREIVQRKAEILAMLRTREADHTGPALPRLQPDRSQWHAPFPLNEMQEAYWIGRQGAIEMGNVGGHYYMEFESDSLNLAQLTAAWQRMIDRHAMLRAIVHPDGRQQILAHTPPYRLQISDLQGQDPQTVARHLDRVRERLSHQVLKPDRWPLFEFQATQLDRGRTRLHISMDSIIMDAWSFNVLTNDLVQTYRDPTAALPRLDIAFRDYVLAEVGFRDTAVYRRALQYWQARVPTLPPAPDIPLAMNPAQLERPVFVRRSTRLDPRTWQRLKARAAQAGLTPTTIFLAGYAEVLATWSRSAHFTINVPRFNRLPLHPQVNNLVGEFASFTLLEVDNSGHAAFDVRARRIQKQLLTDMEYGYVSGVRVLRELVRAHGRASGALMPVVFTSMLYQGLQSGGESTMTVAKELGEMVYSISQTPQVWMDLQVYEQAGNLLINFDAVEELFPAGLLDDFFGAYCRFLRYLTHVDEAWIETRRVLVPHAQLEQRAAINATTAPVPGGLLLERIAAQAATQPEAPAVISGSCTLTYEALLRRVNRVGRRLRELGARPNRLVAVVMEKGWEQVVGVLGIHAAGAAYLPLDVAFPKERLWYLLQHAEVDVVLTQTAVERRLEWPDSITRLCLDADDWADVADGPLSRVQGEHDLSHVIYTSGSTGLPKGVMIEQRSLTNRIAHVNTAFGVGSQDRALAVTSLHHDLSCYDIFGLLSAGGALVMPDADAARDPAHWAALLGRAGVTVWNSVPAFMELLVDYLEGVPSRAAAPGANLRLVLLSGDWIPVTLPDRLRARVAEARIISLGGPTETTIWDICYPIGRVDRAWKSIPYGRPMLNAQYHVLNESLEPCPIWVPGELYIGGTGLARGYWRDEEKTAARFIEHRQSGERLYRSGDVGRYLPDGTIEFMGRADFQVKIGGYRIELGEIEATLMRHPAVRATVAAAATDRQGLKRLLSYIVPEQDQAPTAQELRAFLAERLPPQMVPSVFVFLEALPLTPNGKVDRRQLPEPGDAGPQRHHTTIAPRNAQEAQVAAVWENLLDVHPVGVTDNFFELGGNSLLAMRMLTELQKQFAWEVPREALFRGATIEELVRALNQQNGPASRTPALALQPAGANPPFFCVHPAGGSVFGYLELARLVGSAQPFYGLQDPALDEERPAWVPPAAMAAQYIDAIRAIQPEGPYYLGGHSFGGIVALEMAHQLQAAGQEVAFLALLNTMTPEAVRDLVRGWRTASGWLHETGLGDEADAQFGSFKHLEYAIHDRAHKAVHTFSYQDLIELAPEDELAYFRELATMARIIHPQMSPQEIRYLLRAFKDNFRGELVYEPPGIYQGRITFFQAAEKLPWKLQIRPEDDDPVLAGWRAACSETLEVHPVPGNHHTMLAAPNVADLAATLAACLHRAQSGTAFDPVRDTGRRVAVSMATNPL